MQRKLEMETQDANKNDKSLKSSVKEQKYRPPVRNNPTCMYTGRNARGVSDTAEKLANMAISSGRPTVKQPLPPPMKAGGWHGPTDLFLGQSHEIQSGRTYTRKVAG